MARLSTMLFAAVVALALVCSAASVPASEETVLQRSRRFSKEGIFKCLAMLGLAGPNELVHDIEENCMPLGDGIKYRICAMEKLAKLGAMYIQCVALSS